MKHVPPPPIYWPRKAVIAPAGATAQRRAAAVIVLTKAFIAPPPTKFGAAAPAVQRATARPAIAPPPTRFPGAVQAKPAPGRIVQRSKDPNAISSDEEEDEDDSLSEYSQHSPPPSPHRSMKAIGGRSKKVIDTYVEHRHDPFSQPINTSEGLKERVLLFDTAKNAAANTHVLYRHEQDDKYTAVSIGTATAMKGVLKRYAFDSDQNVQSKFGKKQHIHAEMWILHQLTGGDVDGIPGVLEGYTLVVDKPVCASCYPYVVSADPAEVRDTTDFWTTGADQRQRWENWKSPFR